MVLLNPLHGYKTRVPYLKPRFHSLYWPLGSAHDLSVKTNVHTAEIQTTGSGQRAGQLNQGSCPPLPEPRAFIQEKSRTRPRSHPSIHRAPFSIRILYTVFIRRGKLKGREGGAGRRPAYASVIGPVAASSGLSRFSLRFLLPRNGHKGLHHMPGSVLGSFLMLLGRSPVESSRVQLS